MGGFYLNSYAPLVVSVAGRRSAEEHRIDPFVDGSIRREPDLEHDFPGISCLCRGSQFAPRLRTGDIVAYITKVGRFGKRNRHQRLTAILQVESTLPSHAAAADWYTERNLPLPSNCMVPDNISKPLDQSHRKFRGSRGLMETQIHRAWDASYRISAKKRGTFVVCRKLWSNLSWSAPVFIRDDLFAAFGYPPGTQTPGELNVEGFNRFIEQLEIPLPPFAADHSE